MTAEASSVTATFKCFVSLDESRQFYGPLFSVTCLNAYFTSSLRIFNITHVNNHFLIYM